jgi:hypothetical protein
MLCTGNCGLFQNAGNPSRVSRSSVYQALCVPASCSHKDIEAAVSQYLQKYKHPAGVHYTAAVAPNLCHTSQQESYSFEDYIFMLVQFVMLYVGINICSACFNFRNPHILHHNAFHMFCMMLRISLISIKLFVFVMEA